MNVENAFEEELPYIDNLVKINLVNKKKNFYVKNKKNDINLANSKNISNSINFNFNSRNVNETNLYNSNSKSKITNKINNNNISSTGLLLLANSRDKIEIQKSSEHLKLNNVTKKYKVNEVAQNFTLNGNIKYKLKNQNSSLLKSREKISVFPILKNDERLKPNNNFQLKDQQAKSLKLNKFYIHKKVKSNNYQINSQSNSSIVFDKSKSKPMAIDNIDLFGFDQEQNENLKKEFKNSILNKSNRLIMISQQEKDFYNNSTNMFNDIITLNNTNKQIYRYKESPFSIPKIQTENNLFNSKILNTECKIDKENVINLRTQFNKSVNTDSSMVNAESPIKRLSSISPCKISLQNEVSKLKLFITQIKNSLSNAEDENNKLKKIIDDLNRSYSEKIESLKNELNKIFIHYQEIKKKLLDQKSELLILKNTKSTNLSNFFNF